MRTVILCEGSDDLSFIAYYLNKLDGWDTKGAKWDPPMLAYDEKYQSVWYMHKKGSPHSVSIQSTGGQDRLEAVVKDILYMNEQNPMNPVNTLILFRDCDDRPQEDVAHSMESWFGDSVSLFNQEICEYKTEIDEIPLSLSILPVIIPFDEEGAIETLLLKAISDRGTEGKYIVEHAERYISEAKKSVSSYLKKQRLVVKAKFSAAISITNPDHSTSEFMKMMYATSWEKSASIHHHMDKLIQVINGEL